MQLLAKQQKKTIPEAAKVTCHVQLGQPDGKEGALCSCDMRLLSARSSAEQASVSMCDS